MSQRKSFFTSHDHWSINTRKWIILLTFFSLPLSKIAPLILIFLLTILWAFEPSKNKLAQLRINRLSIYLIVLYLIHPLSLIWSDDINFGIQRSLDYIWILFVAIAISQYEDEKIRDYLLSFVAGASIHAIFFYLGYFDIFHLMKSTPLDPSISGNRNTYGPLTAIASISMIYVTMTSNWRKALKLSGLVLALLLLLTVLLNTSRTGHIVLIVLAVTSIAYVAHSNNKKLLGVISAGILLSMFFASTHFIDSIQKRFGQAITDIHLYEEANPLTSTGVRISFYQNTIELQSKRSVTEQVIGSGVGDYADDFNAFIEKKPEALPGLRKDKSDIEGWHRFRDLHSQFLMNLLMFGYVGILLIIALTIITYSQAKKNKDFIMTGLFISIFIALMVNSVSQSAMETRGLAPTYFLMLGMLFARPHQKTKNHE